MGSERNTNKNEGEATFGDLSRIWESVTHIPKDFILKYPVGTSVFLVTEIINGAIIVARAHQGKILTPEQFHQEISIVTLGALLGSGATEIVRESIGLVKAYFSSRDNNKN